MDKQKSIWGLGWGALMQACGWADLCCVLLCFPSFSKSCLGHVVCAWSWAEPWVQCRAGCVRL